MLFDRLTHAIESGVIVPTESFIEDLINSVVNLELDRIVNSEVNPFEIIGTHIRFGRAGLYDKSVLDLLDELFDELELKGFQCYEEEDGTLDCAEFDDYLIEFLSRHFSAIDLAKVVGVVNDTNGNKS